MDSSANDTTVASRDRMTTIAVTRKSTVDFVLASGMALLYAMLPWPAGARPPHVFLAAAAIGLAAISARFAHRAVFSASLLTALTAVAWLVDPRFLPWPASFALPLGVYALLVWRIPSLRAAAPQVRRGEISGTILLLGFAIVATSSSALILWRWLLRPDLSDLDRMLPNQPVPLLLLGGLGFALLNAFLEEAVFRVVYLEALEAVGPGWLAVAVQALAFGALHLHGFPRGAIGVGLATIYGLMLGALRLRARGMLAVYVAHVFADITIFTILLFWVRSR